MKIQNLVKAHICVSMVICSTLLCVFYLYTKIKNLYRRGQCFSQLLIPPPSYIFSQLPNNNKMKKFLKQMNNLRAHVYSLTESVWYL